MSSTESNSSKLESILSDLLGSQIISLERVNGGKNSQVYHLISKTSAEENHFAVKQYFRHPSDTRERLRVEFSSLEFMWENGIRNIPQPVLADYVHDCAVYKYIDGHRLAAAEIGEAEIDQAVQFLSALQEIRTEPGFENLQAASEACFSVQEIIDNLEKRLSCLQAVRNDTSIHEQMYNFVEEKLQPALIEARQICRDGLVRFGKTLTSELPQEERFLSPSDFGFHNALRRTDGQLVFIDFEYFGWDDPAKTIIDFLLHPDPIMDLPAQLKNHFVNSFYMTLSPRDDFMERVHLVYPFYVIKWCIILPPVSIPLDEIIIAGPFSLLSCLEDSRSRCSDTLLQSIVHFSPLNFETSIPWYDWYLLYMSVATTAMGESIWMLIRGTSPWRISSLTR